MVKKGTLETQTDNEKTEVKAIFLLQPNSMLLS